jgi:hypothetical protein
MKQAGEHDDPEICMVVKDAEGREVFTLSFWTISYPVSTSFPLTEHAQERRPCLFKEIGSNSDK